MFVSYAFVLTIFFGVALTTLLVGVGLIGFSLMMDYKKTKTEFKLPTPNW